MGSQSTVDSNSSGLCPYSPPACHLFSESHVETDVYVTPGDTQASVLSLCHVRCHPQDARAGGCSAFLSWLLWTLGHSLVILNDLGWFRPTSWWWNARFILWDSVLDLFSNRNPFLGDFRSSHDYANLSQHHFLPVTIPPRTSFLSRLLCPNLFSFSHRSWLTCSKLTSWPSRQSSVLRWLVTPSFQLLRPKVLEMVLLLHCIPRIRSVWKCSQLSLQNLCEVQSVRTPTAATPARGTGTSLLEPSPSERCTLSSILRTTSADKLWKPVRIFHFLLKALKWLLTLLTKTLNPYKWPRALN